MKNLNDLQNQLNIDDNIYNIEYIGIPIKIALPPKNLTVV